MYDLLYIIIMILYYIAYQYNEIISCIIYERICDEYTFYVYIRAYIHVLYVYYVYLRAKTKFDEIHFFRV